MKITSRDEKIYSVELTAKQAHHLHIFLELGRDGHINELSVCANYNQEMTDAIHETLLALRDVLEQR